MKEISNTLNIRQLNKLVEQGKAVLFNYSAELPNLTVQELLIFINGDGNALVNDDLYIKHGSADYKLQVKDWVHSEEARKYVRPLLKINHKNNLSTYISRHLN